MTSFMTDQLLATGMARPGVSLPPPAAGTVVPPGRAPAGYDQLRIGQRYGGFKISSIFYQSPDMIIFGDADGRVRHSGIPEDALRESQRVLNQSDSLLAHMFDPLVNSMLGRALTIAVTRPPGEDVSRAFKEIDEFIQRRGPVKIFGTMPQKYNVFTDKTGEVIISYPTIPDGLRPVAAEVKRLSQTARVILRDAEYAKLSQLLAAESAAAIANPPPESTSVATVLQATNDFLEHMRRSRVQTFYVAASLISAVFLDCIAALICLQTRFPVFGIEDKALLLAIVGATAGAFASILQRSGDMEVNRFVPLYQVWVQGFVRVFLGLLFGVFLYEGIQSKLIFEKLTTEKAAIFLLSVIAGMSERFVPDLLERIAGGAKKAASTTTTSSLLAVSAAPTVGAVAERGQSQRPGRGKTTKQQEKRRRK